MGKKILTDKERDRVSVETAKIIGETSPTIIRDIIEASNELGYMVHGVQKNQDYQNVRRNGIKPRTPEGAVRSELSSFWSNGTAIFGDLDGDRLATYGSTFFHYGHSHDPDRPEKYMTLAIVRHPDLVKAGLKVLPFEPDTQLEVYGQVPRHLMELVRVGVRFPDPERFTGREKGQIGERLLLQELDRALRHGYRPGTLSKVNYTVRK